MPFVLMAGTRALRYTKVLDMAPSSATSVTGPMRATIPSDVVGSSVGCPKTLLPGCTVSRLPSCPSSFRRPDFDDWEMPSTPTMAAMPMLIPRADSAARTRRLRKPRLPSRARSRRDRQDPPMSRAGRRIADDPPVPDHDPAIHCGGHREIVGDDHDGRPLSVQLAEQVQERCARHRVEVARGFVGHHECRAAGEGTGDGGALLLATRELIRVVPHPVAEADAVDGRLGQSPALGQPSAPVQQAVGDVVEHAEAVEQEELLEDEAEAP